MSDPKGAEPLAKALVEALCQPITAHDVSRVRDALARYGLAVVPGEPTGRPMPEQTDPLNTALPCDVNVPGAVFRKGVALRIFVDAAARWKTQAGEAFAAQAAPRGCVCPPTAEQTCQAPLCPRQGIHSLSPFGVRRETI